MNVWDALFSTQPTEPPQFDLLWYGSLFTLLALTVFSCLSFMVRKKFVNDFPDFTGRSINSTLRLVFGKSDAFDRKSTLYHCRLAMFIVLLLPGVSRVKQYFAVLGTFGTLAAFVYPVPDPYPFPTSLSCPLFSDT